MTSRTLRLVILDKWCGVIWEKVLEHLLDVICECPLSVFYSMKIIAIHIYIRQEVAADISTILFGFYDELQVV